MDPPPDYPESPMDPEDLDATPCKGCGKILKEGRALELDGHRWHRECFRCATCNTLVNHDSIVLVLNDGSLMCNNCTYSCKACGNKIEHLAILTPDNHAYCAECFKCRNCKKKIENLRYAGTSQGPFCMDCHDALMARRRKKSKKIGSKKTHRLDKPLPSLPLAAAPSSTFLPSEPLKSQPIELLESLPPYSLSSAATNRRDEFPAESERDSRGTLHHLSRQTIDALHMTGFEMLRDDSIVMASGLINPNGPSPLAAEMTEKMNNKSQESNKVDAGNLSSDDELRNHHSNAYYSVPRRTALPSTREQISSPQAIAAEGTFISPLQAEISNVPSRSAIHQIDSTSDPTESRPTAVFSSKPSHETSGTMSTYLMEKQDHSSGVDDASVYSADSIFSEGTRTSYVQMLAAKILEHIPNSKSWRSSSTEILTELPDLLRSFACQLGYQKSDKTHLQAMLFVHKHRHRIVEALKTQISSEDVTIHESDNETRPNPRVVSPAMTLEDKMSLWHANTESGNKHESQIIWPKPDATTEGDGESDPYDPDLLSYADVVLNSVEYQWLCDRISRQINYQVFGPNRMLEIADKIIKLQPGTGSKVRRQRSESLRVEFAMSWHGSLLQDNIERLRGWGFDEEEIVCINTLEQALVLTGSSIDAIATTCGDYLEQIWSVRGQQIMELLKKTLSKPGELFGGEIKVNSRIKDDQLIFLCEGEVHAISEIAEMLGWLVAALHPSQDHEDLYMLTPVVSVVEDRMPGFSSIDGLRTVTCHISTIRQKATQSLQGQCWHAMFRNPIVTEGYPIPRRDNTGCGLELSLGMIASLLRTNSTTIRNGLLAIRGFSQALIPTCRMGDTIKWHHIYNADGQSLPYWRIYSHDVINIGSDDLPYARHIIGWSSRATSIAGAPGNHYRIGRSHLPAPSQRILLEAFSVSGSQFAGLSIPVKFGVRWPMLHAHTNELILRIIKLRRSFVVLWDDLEKRGWLIDGQSALLHLLRASLQADSTTEDLEDILCFDASKISEPTGRYPEAVKAFFFEGTKFHPNMNIQIFSPEPGCDYLVRHRVEHLCRILSDAIDLQSQMANKDGIQFTANLRQNLHGWDFVDFATDLDLYKPCEVTLPYRGAAWVDLVRQINAVVLFGRGFGDIIQPLESEDLCSYWSTLPKQEYYLATCASTITRLVERYTGAQDQTTKLTNDLIWYNPKQIFATCKCLSGIKKHSDYTQVIWPVRLQSLLPKTTPIQWSKESAIIFGQNTFFSWYWPAKGDPCRQKPPARFENHILTEAENASSSLSSSETSQTQSASADLSRLTSPTSLGLETTVNKSVSRLQKWTALIKSKNKPRHPIV